MYYKIENQECEVYKKLHELRTKELQIEADNINSIKERTGLDYETYLGHSGQQNFCRVTQYVGFKFKEPNKVNLKIWQKHKEHIDIFVPNRKTKLGREMWDFLNNGLKSSFYRRVFEILNVPVRGSFTFPYLEIVNDTIVIFLGQNQEPSNPNVIEITKREFNELLDISNAKQ